MATVDDFVEQTFPVICKGRDHEGNEVLEKGILVNVKVYKSPQSNTISTDVECHYSSGPHGELCQARIASKSPGFAGGAEVCCVYAVDLPYATDYSIARGQNPQVSSPSE